MELRSVAALFALFHKHHKLVLIGTSPLCPNSDCSSTALKFQTPYKVSINSQTLLVALNKCTRITRMLAMGTVTAFVCDNTNQLFGGIHISRLSEHPVVKIMNSKQTNHH